jgi:hypothetical protein
MENTRSIANARSIARPYSVARFHGIANGTSGNARHIAAADTFDASFAKATGASAAAHFAETAHVTCADATTVSSACAASATVCLRISG